MYDENLTYQADTQSLIGDRIIELANPLTGEVEAYRQTTKRIYGQQHFWKVYLPDFLSVVAALNGKQTKVLHYILSNIRASDNLFADTYRHINECTTISLSTVTRTMQILEDKKFLKKMHNGLYMINPRVIVKGNDFKRDMLIRKFESSNI